MGGLCSSATQTNNAQGARTIEEAPMLTLEDFAQEQQQFVGQLAKLSSKSARQIEPVKKPSGSNERGPAAQVDPVIAHEFVETAKAIKSKQNQLFRQIILLGNLFEMSIASLSKSLSVRTQKGLAESEKSRSIKKSMESIERAAEKLHNLKNKVKRLDPNQESLNNIRVRVSQSQLSVNPFQGDASTRSSSDLRRSIAASSMISDLTPSQNDPFDVAPDAEENQEELHGKVQDYLLKLNEILLEYERQRVIESALINITSFNALLQAFMDLPEGEQLLDQVKHEENIYRELSAETHVEITELERVVSESQADTTQLFNKLDDIQRLYDKLMWQNLLSSIASKKAQRSVRLARQVTLTHLQQVKDQKVLELGKLEHQVSVILLSNPDATAKIEACQNEIKTALQEFMTLSVQESVEVETLIQTIYRKLCVKIQVLKVLLSGNELTETIEELIEFNQQVTLDLNEADRDTAKGVEIEEKLDGLANETEEKAEQNGFLTEEDICAMQATLIELLPQVTNQERLRDQVIIDRQIKSDAEESREHFDLLATIVSDYYRLREDLIKVEAEVYEYGRILQSMPSARAEKFKAKLWLAWNDLQKIMKTFASVRLGQEQLDAMAEQIVANTGLMQVQVQSDEYRDSLTEVRNVLKGDLANQLRDLHDQIDSDPSEESKMSDQGDGVRDPLLVIAENNQLNEVDQAMQYIMKVEQAKLRKRGYQADFPPFFRVKSEGDTNTDQSCYCMQMGIKLNTGGYVCKKVQKGTESQAQSFLLRKDNAVPMSRAELEKVKVGIKMHSGSYMFVNRLGSYHQNLNLDAFFSIKLTKLEDHVSLNSEHDVPTVEMMDMETDSQGNPIMD